VEPILVKSVEQLPQTLARIVRDGDVIVTMGAGNIGSVPAELTQTLAQGASA
jgi:UDP-N-acetylmuramate--alanine ligase